MKTITLELLKQKHACTSQVELFQQTFGTSAALTKTNLKRAVAAGLQIDWLKNLLTPAAWAEYERVIVPAWAEYERVIVPALAEYERIKASAWTEYERVTAPAWAEYERVTALAWAEYERAKYEALLNALRGME